MEDLIDEVVYNLPYDPVYRSLQISSYPFKSSLPYIKKHKVKLDHAHKAFSIPSIPHNERKFGYFITPKDNLCPLNTLLQPMAQKPVMCL